MMESSTFVSMEGRSASIPLVGIPIRGITASGLVVRMEISSH